MKFNLIVKESLTIDETKRINSLIDSNQGVVFQEPVLNEVVSYVFKTKLLHYLVYENNELIAYCAGHKTKNRFLTKVELKPLYDIPYGGFVRNNTNHRINDLISTLPRKYITKYLYSSAPVLNELNNTGEYKHFVRRETVVVDLSLAENDIWENVVHSKRRNMIRKALNAGISTEKYINEEGLQLFWPILNSLHNNLGYNHLTYEYYSSILSLYFKENKAVILLAIKNDEIIAGVIVLGNKNMMHYWKGASKQNIANEGQGDLLQWEAIKYSKEYGAKYYDLCVVETKLLPQIAKFKLGFSNIMVPFYTKSYRTIFYKVINRIVNIKI